MFERYTEKARRVVFFSRYEASLLGSQQIEPQHIMLGIVREAPDLILRLIEPSRMTLDEIRARIVQSPDTKQQLSASLNLSLSVAAKAILSQASDEAFRLQHRNIGPEHLLLGVFAADTPNLKSVLGEIGLTEDAIRADLGRNSEDNPETNRPFSRDEMMSVVSDMRALANSMLRKCDLLENWLHRMPPFDDKGKGEQSDS